MQDPYDHLKNRARNLLSTGISTGISIFNTVASNFNAADDASSGDEERPNVAETDSYVEKGIRGVLVFPTTSQKTGKRKMIHINLYKSQFISYHDGHKRVHSCSDVLSTAKVSELQINMELKGNRRKRIIFDGEGMADKFHMYMEFINEQGRAIRRAFNDIDVNRSGRIVRGDLERAMMKTDLAADNEVIERMLIYGATGHDCVDYSAFFHLFLSSFVANLRECLQEWCAQATADESEVMTSHRLAQMIRLLPGEIISFMPPEKVHWCVSGGSHKNCQNQVIFPGRICATNYRVLFLSSRKAPSSLVQQSLTHSRFDIPAFFNLLSLPLGSILRIYTAAPRSSIYLQGKDYRIFRVTLAGAENNKGNVDAYLQMLLVLTFPPSPSPTLAPTLEAGSASTSTKDTLSASNSTSQPSPAASAIVHSSNASASTPASNATHGNATSRSASTSSNAPSFDPSPTNHSINNINAASAMANASAALAARFFAYQYALERSWHDPSADLAAGWQRADIVKEYERQGLVGSSVWRIVENKDYELSKGYPRYLAVPRQMTPDQIKAAAAYRSQGRMPVITYRHRATSAVLVRAAQPLVGLTQKHCYEDKLLLDLYRTLGWGAIHYASTSSSSTTAAPTTSTTLASTAALTVKEEHEHGNTNQSSTTNTAAPTSTPATSNLANSRQKLFILDARGKLAATLNMAAGKGTEDTSNYTNTELLFGNIDNIHTMRQSAWQYAEALAFRGQQGSAGTSSGYGGGGGGGGGGGAGGGEGSSYLHPHASLYEVLKSPDAAHQGMNARIEDSGWLKHCRLLLQASVFAAEKLHADRCSVLVHCSDGWDRTAQICSLAQVLLDPYFRTLEGLATLVEKDWCAFGHKFHERLGHGADDKTAPDERSPVFLQFLDCLFQIMHQFPRCFEYTEDTLVFLADHSTSCLFGTFLGNNEMQRRSHFSCLDQTASLWAYLLRPRHRHHRFLQRDYEAYNGVLWPRLALHELAVWRRYWCRWDVNAHPHAPHLSGQQTWQDDWGDQLNAEDEIAPIPSPLPPTPPLTLTHPGLTTPQQLQQLQVQHQNALLMGSRSATPVGAGSGTPPALFSGSHSNSSASSSAKERAGTPPPPPSSLSPKSAGGGGSPLPPKKPLRSQNSSSTAPDVSSFTATVAASSSHKQSNAGSSSRVDHPLRRASDKILVSEEEVADVADVAEGETLTV